MRVGMGVLTFAIFLCILGSEIEAQSSRPGDSASQPANTVGAGTRFLTVLENTLNTQSARAGDRFRVRTLEPLALSDGSFLHAGLEIRGHIDKVESAHQAGRARLWLTFDELRTPAGWLPLVADLTDVLGVHSIKVDYERDGEIEARTSKRQAQVEAATAGAVAGAAGGVAAHSGRDAAMAAAAGAATGFMMASGLGQEFTLVKNTKLELILDRPFYPDRY